MMKKNNLFWIIFLVLISIYSSAQHLPEQLVSSPIFIKHKYGTGSGFYLFDSLNVYFVTARHNLVDQQNKIFVSEIELTSYHKDPTTSDKNVILIDIQSAYKGKFLNSKPIYDILIIKIADFESGDNSKGAIKYYSFVTKKSSSSWVDPIPIDVIRKFSDVYIGDEVFVFGYPSSIGLKQSPQFDHSRPLLRKGVVAAKYDKNKTIILDCPTYKGNSGGPVIRAFNSGLAIEYTLIGIVIEYIPYEEQWINTKSGQISADIYNSDYSVAIPADYILELISDFGKRQN